MKTATLRKDGNRQSVELPEEFRLDGEKVYINKVENIIALIPEAHAWETLFESLDQFSDDFMDDRKQSPAQTREEMFT